MRKLTKLIIVTLALMASGVPAVASNAEEQSCQFAAAMGDGTDAMLEILDTLAAKWADADRAKLDPVFRPQLGKFKFEKGKVYRVANFPPFMQEYLIVTADYKIAQPVFFRLKFGGGRDGFIFRNIVFNTDFEEIFEVGTISPPIEITCAEIQVQGTQQ